MNPPKRPNQPFNQYRNPLRRPHSANYDIELSHRIVRSPSYIWDKARSKYCRSQSATPPMGSPSGCYSHPPSGPSSSPTCTFSRSWGTSPRTPSSPMSGNSVPWGSSPGTSSSPTSRNSCCYGSPLGTSASPTYGIPFPPACKQKSLSPSTLAVLLQGACTARPCSNSDSADNGANNNCNMQNGPDNNNGQSPAECNIAYHLGPIIGPGFGRPSPPPPAAPQVRPPAPTPTPSRSPRRRFCQVHPKLQLLWCQTCSVVFCKECYPFIHDSHMYSLLFDVLVAAGIRATQVLNDAKSSIKILTDELEEVQVAAKTLEDKAQEASIEVMIAFERIIMSLHARQQELLKKIESARIYKSGSLRYRDQSLRNGISKLTTTIERLSEVLEASADAVNPLELLKTKDMTSAEIFHAVRCRHHLSPTKDGWISFAGLDEDVSTLISNFGSILLTNPGPIGDGRGNDGRRDPAKVLAETCSDLVQRKPAPCGRPVGLTRLCVSLNPLIMEPVQRGSIDIFGNTSGPRDNLCRPWGVACDKDGHIVVADRSNNRIQIYNRELTLIRQFGSHGSAPGQFDRPAGITLDCRKRIVVADKDNHRIQIFTMDGQFLLTFGEKGSRCGQFNYPWDVAANNECQIVVSDTRNHRVQLFSGEGIFLRKYGFETMPNMWKFFDSPRGVAFDPEGRVVATDFNNHRLIVINPSFLNARLIDCDNDGPRQMDRPQGVIVDDVGNILVADSRNHRLQIFDQEGNCRWRFGTFGDGPDEMDRPSGIAITPTGRVLVVDFGNNRIMMI